MAAFRRLASLRLQRRLFGRTIDGERRIDAGPRAEPVVAQDCLQRRKAGQHVFLAADIAHGADAPDLAVQRPERGADLDAEIVQHHAAHRVAVDAVREYRRRSRSASCGSGRRTA